MTARVLILLIRPLEAWHAWHWRRAYRAGKFRRPIEWSPVQPGACRVVHAPEIWGGYCETHKSPVYEGHPCVGGAPHVVSWRLESDPRHWVCSCGKEWWS